MTFNEYQIQAIETDIHTKDNAIICCSLGLVGEAGEVAEKFKKIFRDKNGVIKEADKVYIAKEMGDVLWYVSALAYHLNINLNEIAELNLRKLKDRMTKNQIMGSGDER